MNQQKGTVNIKSLLSTLDKISSSYFQNNNKIIKNSKHKDNQHINKMQQNSHYSNTNTNITKKEKILEFNNFFTNNNINNGHNKISLYKQAQNNFAKKRSLSKSIFNSINLMNNNYNNNLSLNKKSNIYSGGLNNNN